MSGGNAEGCRRDATIARRDENLGVKNGLKVLSTRSRVYLSGGSVEFDFICSESWVLSVIMVLSFGTSTVAGILVLAEVVFWSLLKCWSFQTNVMSIDRRAVQMNVRLCGQHDYSNSLVCIQRSIY